MGGWQRTLLPVTKSLLERGSSVRSDFHWSSHRSKPLSLLLPRTVRHVLSSTALIIEPTSTLYPTPALFLCLMQMTWVLFKQGKRLFTLDCIISITEMIMNGSKLMTFKSIDNPPLLFGRKQEPHQWSSHLSFPLLLWFLQRTSNRGTDFRLIVRVNFMDILLFNWCPRDPSKRFVLCYY